MPECDSVFWTARRMQRRRNGDAYVIEPGHDAWVVGSEVFVGYEFDSKAAETYASS